MLRNLVTGIAAGAVGTVALNAATYADMALRGRPASGVPAQVVERLAAKAGFDLSGDDETTRNRKSALGALSGYAVGLSAGAAYGTLRPLLGDVPLRTAGVGLGLAAMAGSDVPATALGVTDPRQWGVNAWVSDLVPHLAYGFMAALAYENFAGER